MALKPLPAKLILIFGALLLAGCEKEEAPATKQPPVPATPAPPAARPAAPPATPQPDRVSIAPERQQTSETGDEAATKADEPTPAETLVNEAGEAGWEIRENPDGSTLVLPPR